VLKERQFPRLPLFSYGLATTGPNALRGFEINPLLEHIMASTDSKTAPARKQKPARADTKTRILDTAQDLFNERGVNSVTTNHIAAELGISPGNLYYHYRNKEDIVWHLFQRVEVAVDPILRFEPGEIIDAERMASDITRVMQVMMDFRFLFSDIVGLVNRDPRIREEFRALQDRTVQRIAGTFRTSYAAGPLVDETPDFIIEALARNLWMIIINWISFVQSANDDPNAPITQADLAQGVFHIFAMMRPYTSDEAIKDLESMFDFTKMLKKD